MIKEVSLCYGKCTRCSNMYTVRTGFLFDRCVDSERAFFYKLDSETERTLEKNVPRTKELASCAIIVCD